MISLGALYFLIRKMNEENQDNKFGIMQLLFFSIAWPLLMFIMLDDILKELKKLN
jgi:hypothetical protein